MSRALPLLSLALLPLATVAHAVPSPANSSIPAHVLLVGHAGAVPDTLTGAFTVVVRDLANNPMPGRLVEFRLINCPGARLAEDQMQPGASVLCATHGVTATSDIAGVVRLAVLGGGDATAPPGSGPCAQVFASSVLLGYVAVAYLDLDGSGGLGINDMSLWLGDFGLGEPIARSDFDGDGKVDINDLSLWLGIWSSGGSAESATAYCP